MLQYKATNIAELVTLLSNVVGYFYLGLTILGTLVTSNLVVARGNGLICNPSPLFSSFMKLYAICAMK